MQLWQIGAAANLIVAVAYLAISLAIVRPLIREGQLRSNPLGLATAAIFFTCAVHHGSHSVHMLLPYVGIEVHAGMALRTAFTGHVVIWDIITAAVGIYYWTLRRTYGSLMQGARLFNDMKEQRRQALRIGDEVVQELVIVQGALALNERDTADKALRSALESARNQVTELLGEPSGGAGEAPQTLAGSSQGR